jgi:hypothetical protein
MIGKPDAAGELRKQSDVFVLFIDSLKIVRRRIEEIAGRHLRVACARIEQCRRARHIVVSGDDAIELDGFLNCA